MFNTITKDIGDARGARTRVVPRSHDESFYFVLEPGLPSYKYVFRIRYACSPQKAANIASSLRAAETGAHGAVSQKDLLYYVTMAEFCTHDYYW